MEKIYMEENKKKKRSVINTSVVLSFVVSLFAIFSLAVFGIVSNQGTTVSYAKIPTDLEGFNFRTEVKNDQQVYIDVPGSVDYRVPIYYASADDSQQIFCVEHTADVSDTEYVQGDDITDFGLLYLLNNSYANGVKVTDAVDANSKYVETWVTQTAIWVYLAKKHPSDSKHTITASQMDIITNATRLTVTTTETGIPDYNKGSSIYNAYVKPLVEAAETASNTAKLTVSKKDDEVKPTEDKKYYESSLITVVGTPSGDLKNYDVSISGIEGAFIVGEDFKKIDSLTGLEPGTKFYVRVPADKVTEKVQELSINVKGHFKTLAGKYYVAASGNKQKVVSVNEKTIEVPASTKIEFVGTPDTGMNTAQTIYFIGLIVLLCGVGIVYANAKPVQVK